MVLALALCSLAQNFNATLTGSVTDPSGAAVSGASLTLINTATNSTATFTSDERGEYSFRNLSPGTYDLSIVRDGFETSVQKGIVLTINASARADVALKVGKTSETVEVVNDSTLINYDNATVQGGVDPGTLQNLPVAVANGNQRSSASLAVLLPGITTGSTNEAFNARINGGTQSGDEAVLDGATMSEGYMNQSGMVAIQGDFPFSPDMISEMKVLTSSYEPQYGNSTSAQILVVSKGGSDRFHGSGYEYLRNNALNATPWNSPGKKPFDQENDFGANIGGPIKLPGFHGPKNKGYFFFNWEYYKQNGGASVPTLSIASLKERQGDFTDFPHPIYDPSTGQQFQCNGVLNVICPNRIDPVAAAWLAQLPTPTNLNFNNNYVVPHAVPGGYISGTNVYFWRVDDNWGDKDRFYYTYYRQWGVVNPSTALPLPISTSEPVSPENAPIQRFNWEHTFSPVMTNHFTMGYLNRNEGKFSLNFANAQKAGLPGVAGVARPDYFPQFNYNGFSQLGLNDGPEGIQLSRRPTWTINDLLSRVVGSHTLTAGIEWRAATGNTRAGINQGGTFTFNGNSTAQTNTGLQVGGDPGGSAMADMLIGAASGANTTFYNVLGIYPRQTAWAVHAGDTWRATSKLTLSYGMRWDMETPSRDKHNNFSFLDLNASNPGAISTATGQPLMGALAVATSQRPYPEKVFYGGFAPRLGVAYALDQKTVVRAGYGVFFGQAFYPGWNGGMAQDGFNLNASPNGGGTVNGVTIPAVCLSAGTFCVQSFGLAGGFPTPAVTQNLAPESLNGTGSGTYRTVNGNERPRAEQWNLTLERQFASKIFVSAAYVGSHGSRLLSNLAPANVLNPSDPRVQAVLAQTSGQGNSNPLNDVFTSGGPTTVDGVTAPYVNFAQQLGGCATVAQALVPYPQFCQNLQGLNENVGTSDFNSFQFNVQKRFTGGSYMLISYTNSKLIEDGSENVQRGCCGSGANGVVSPFDRARARTLSSDDIPQVVSAAFVYQLPFGRGKKFGGSNEFADKIIGGWQISPVIKYSRGQPMFFRSGLCNVPSQLRESCIPSLVPGIDPFLQDPNSYNPNKGPLLNVLAFEPASNFNTPNYAGNGPVVTNLRGPNYKNVNFSITKNTLITERVNFKIGLNFFNAFNAHYFLNDGSFDLGTSGNAAFNSDIHNPSQFGTWNHTVSAPRTIQFTGRFEF